MKHRTLLSISALVALAAFSLCAFGQDDPREQERYKNGLLPTGTYGGSSVTVNLHNGNLTTAIPLVSLPGRAGHNLNITASYNSTQMVRRDNFDGTFDLEYFNEGPTSGRWIINVWPSLQQVGDLYYFTTPDGSVHKLTASGWYYNSHDSTNIRYYLLTSRVEYPDGHYYDFSQYDSEKKVHDVDKNGNRISYQFEPAYPYRPVSITDTLGRVVSLTYVPGTRRLATLVVKNHAGNDLTYSFAYQQYPLQAYPLDGYYGWIQYCEVSDRNLLSSLTLPNGTQYTFSYKTYPVLFNRYWDGQQWVNIYSDSSSFQLEQMTQPTGSTISVDYVKPSIPDVNFAEYVSSITVNPIGTTPFTTTYAYTTTYNEELEVATVTSTTETRPDGSKHIVDWGSAGLRSTETYKDTDGTTTLQTASSSWVTGTYGKNVSVKDTVRYAGSSQMATHETQEYDYLGNPTISLLYADGYWQSQTRRYYDYPGGQLFARLRRQESLQTQKEGKTYSSFTTDTVEYLYDEFALTDRGGAVLQQAPGYGPTYTTRHNPTTVRRYLASEDRWVNVARTYYDTVGNVVQKKDALNRIVETIQYSLDYAHAYPTQVTNALGHSSFTNYLVAGQPKSWSGLPVSTTDANNQTTSFQYDAMNRTSRVDAPNGAWETTTHNDTYFTEAYRTTATTARSIDATHATSETSYYDGLGRLLRSERSEGGGVVSRVDREYALCGCTGKTARVSMPYRPGETIYWTESRYDGAGRVKKVIPPDGTASTNFTEYKYGIAAQFGSETLLLTGVYNAKGIGKVQAYDSLGRLRQVREDAAADFSSSVITYCEQRMDGATFTKPDPNNPYSYLYYRPWTTNEITQGVQLRSNKSDSLGRLRFESHPENGTVTYAYDDAGRLLTKTDARGIVTTMGYDGIDRPSTVTFSDGTPGITNTYDQGSFGIGRLSTVTNGIATNAYIYNNVGQVLREDKTINGLAFYTTSTYNLAGQALTTRLPNGTTITNNYDGVGRMVSMTSDWVDANHPATLASNFVYNAAGAVTSMDYGNGTRMTRSFNTGMQLHTLRHGLIGTPGSILNYEYGYQEGVSNTGQIMSIIDYNDRTKDVSYTYDRFHRLLTAETAGTHWGLTWGYDRYGNRLSQTVTKGTAPTNSLTVSTTTNRVTGWNYDAAGNTLYEGRHSYTYNALNQQATMDATTEYRYDASGNRVMKISGGTITYYVLGGEYVSGTWQKLSVSATGTKLLEYASATTYFFHADHLGTARAQTNVSGQVVDSWSNYPYGEQWQQSGIGNKDRYTGKERDPESANDYFGARYYWNGAGSWLGVDPVIEPGVLNRYAYSGDDPVNNIDPDGRKYYGFECWYNLKKENWFCKVGWEPPPPWENNDPRQRGSGSGSGGCKELKWTPADYKPPLGPTLVGPHPWGDRCKKRGMTLAYRVNLCPYSDEDALTKECQDYADEHEKRELVLTLPISSFGGTGKTLYCCVGDKRERPRGSNDKPPSNRKPK